MDVRAGVDLRFWKTARNQKKKFTARSGSTVYVRPTGENNGAWDQQKRFLQERSIWYIDDKLHFCCAAWSFKNTNTTEPNGQPSEELNATPEVLELIPAEAVMCLARWDLPAPLFQALRLPLQVRLATKDLQADNTSAGAVFALLSGLGRLAVVLKTVLVWFSQGGQRYHMLEHIIPLCKGQKSRRTK